MLFIFHQKCLEKIKITLTRFPILGQNVVIQSKNEQDNAKIPHGEPLVLWTLVKMKDISGGEDILPFVLS